jgi:glycosyltransferase involved in cell wall biosynthesis
MESTFSVVVPLYNKEAEIARCLQSILIQTDPAFEVIVVNDGSADGGPLIAESFARIDPRIRVHHQSNAGLAGARNQGVAMARADYVAFLDADDEWLPGHLEALSAMITLHPEAGLLFTAFWVDRGGGWRRRIRVPARYLEQSALISNYYQLPDGMTLPSATAVRKTSIQAVGGYREMFGEDVDLSLRMAAVYPVAYSRRATALWHLDATNRMCVTQESHALLHDPASLMPSLNLIGRQQHLGPTVLINATEYVARRERQAIIRTVLAGHHRHGRELYDVWRYRFQKQSLAVRALLNAPGAIVAVVVRSWWRRASAACDYLRDWYLVAQHTLPNARLSAAPGGRPKAEVR